jgi:hypothetical protein
LKAEKEMIKIKLSNRNMPDFTEKDYARLNLACTRLTGQLKAYTSKLETAFSLLPVLTIQEGRILNIRVHKVWDLEYILDVYDPNDDDLVEMNLVCGEIDLPAAITLATVWYGTGGKFNLISKKD